MVKSNKILHLQEVDSTNEYLKRSYLRKELEDGFAVTSSLQSNGKGQLKKSWDSEPGENLLFSLFKRQDINEGKEKVSFAAALSVAQLVERHALSGEIKIKWPNDILVDGKKIAGILIENRFRGAQLEASFIGVGLNVNQVNFSRFTRQACSLKSISKIRFDLKRLAGELAQLIEGNLKRKKLELLEDYNNLLYLKNEAAPFLFKGEQKTFTTLKVLPSGELLVEREVEQSFALSMGELKFLM